MKKSLIVSLLSATCAIVAAGVAQASATVGHPAPAFTLKDTNGKTVNLADYSGKTVVLEWHNPECPFVMKHYKSGNMQALQSKYTKDGVVWLTVSSTHPSYSEYKKPEVVNGLLKSSNAAPTAYLMDEEGRAGLAYGAKTTPHMFVINPQGNVVYAGGIDDKRSTELADVKTAKNFVSSALDELKAGKAVSVATATPYGCSVKYKA